MPEDNKNNNSNIDGYDDNRDNCRTRRFANDAQRRFYLVGKAFKIGNIAATVMAIFFIGKHFLG
ncbi:MAG: hypothetical protein M3162_08170 [Thermoproteota archaeon]|nr:hypothetical protein [Thermoproteota archaeon]